jgi:hypothetical protein
VRRLVWALDAAASAAVTHALVLPEIPPALMTLWPAATSIVAASSASCFCVCATSRTTGRFACSVVASTCNEPPTGAVVHTSETTGDVHEAESIAPPWQLAWQLALASQAGSASLPSHDGDVYAAVQPPEQGTVAPHASMTVESSLQSPVHEPLQSPEHGTVAAPARTHRPSQVPMHAPAHVPALIAPPLQVPVQWPEHVPLHWTGLDVVPSHSPEHSAEHEPTHCAGAAADPRHVAPAMQLPVHNPLTSAD